MIYKNIEPSIQVVDYLHKYIYIYIYYNKLKQNKTLQEHKYEREKKRSDIYREEEETTGEGKILK
jgi:uncharacterized ion transporter superfamily protein YfcC